jgi:NLR family CARD domain-containing protein 3
VSALLERLRSADPAERAAACRALPQDPAAALLADALLPALDDPAKAVARAAREAVVAIARAGAGDVLVPKLRAASRGTAAGARIQAALALARLEPPDPALLPALVAALDADDADLRWAAARVLVEMGRLHGEIVRVLLGLVADARPNARRMATFCLRELAPDLPAAALALVDASRDGDAQVRRAALVAMAGLLAPPAAVLDRLTEATRESDPIAAKLALLALQRLGAGPATRMETR